MPFFSIIIPTYNSAALIGRALTSCLIQDFMDFEIIIIDSGSTDGTREIVQEFNDDRILVICEMERRGVCPARNLGVKSARSQWLLFLDSDNEFLPGVLRIIYEKVRKVTNDIDHLRFTCKWGTREGGIVYSLADEIWGYEEYIKARERVVSGCSETFSCISKRSFEKVRWPEDQSYESIYHIDFAKNYKTQTFPETVMVYNIDAPNQNSYTPNPRHWLRVAPDNARSMDLIFLRHGEALRLISPTTYLYDLRTAAKYHFLSGNRVKAVRYLLRYLSSKPTCHIGWALLILGTLGPKILSLVDSLKTRFRGRPH